MAGIGVLRVLLLLQALGALDIHPCNVSGQRIDDIGFDRKETSGNSSLGCSASGPCTPCSYTEKSDDEKYHCSTTGYRQPYRCVELGENLFNGDASKETNQEHNRAGGSSLKTMSERVLQDIEHDQERGIDKQGLVGVVGRKLFEAEDVTTHDGQLVFHVFYSCVPTDDTDERLTVLGFEGIVLGLLAVSAPLIYYRRRRSFASSGMTRLSTNTRF